MSHCCQLSIKNITLLLTINIVTVCEGDMRGKDPDASRREVKSYFNEGGRQAQSQSPDKGRNQINRGKSRDRVSENTGRGQGREIQKHRTK